MSGIAKGLLAAALLNCGLLTASAAANNNSADSGQWLKDGACALFDADAHAGDTVSWTGSCTDGYAEGLGTATFSHDGQMQSFTAFFQHGVVPDGHVISRWGQGWRYSGDAVGGRYNGIGILTTDANDRFEGRWVDGKMTGFGVLLRPDGERYAGDWKDDKPNGNGEFRYANGTVVHGLFQDGKLVKAETSVEGTTGSGDLGNQSANQSANQSVGAFGSVSGKTLTGVDGSSIALTLIDGGMELQVVPAEGNARKTTFTFMTDRMGTVVENSGSRGSSVTGFFRLTAKGVEVRYADGHSAMLSANSDGGVQMALDGDAGPSCSAWYPAGHLFSDSDKKIALNAYASKLGLPVAAADTGNGCSPAPQAASVTPPAPPSAPSAAAAPRVRPERHADAKAPMAKASYRVGDYQRTKALEPVAVKTSQIHPIDSDAIAVPSIVGGAVAASVPADKNNASTCLKVDSDGDHWGFRNTCSFAVQFAYCMAGDIACGAKGLVTGATGSVAANGFGALMADTSLKEKDAAHNFRWVACGGGAGEVVAHLDAIEPPAGHCERTASAN